MTYCENPNRHEIDFPLMRNVENVHFFHLSPWRKLSFPLENVMETRV